MGAQLRRHPWHQTPLGPVEGWPLALRVTVEQMMCSRFAAALCWGSELTTIHNDAFVPILGNKPPAFGQPFAAIWAEAWDQIEPMVSRALNGEATFIEDFQLEVLRQARPELAYFTFCYSPVFDGEGRVAGFLDTVIETTGKVQAELLERQERDRMHSMLLTMPGFAAVLSGPEHRFSFVNKAFEAAAGQRAYLGHRADEVLSELHGQGFWEMVNGTYRDGTSRSAQAMAVRFRGEASERYLDLVVDPIHARGGLEGVFISGYDVTQRIRAQEELLAAQQRLQELALTDTLTGLANRRRLDEALANEVRRARREAHPLALVLLDIDRFKQLNDTHGHPAGDVVLRALGQLLGQFAQRAGDLAARFGGEEFVVLLSNADAAQAAAMAERIRRAVESTVADPAGKPVTVSIGVATTGKVATGELLVQQADAALYQAKREGRNRVVVASTVGGKPADRGDARA
ncbi:sensor domain-containing diguanylate cyclase [Pseudorhodoferax sp.]|uniref:sensor domain-containing diguanylate cyclase n=1 Tax=Pseudorhodoferax sp. TaxID=1993553 RepID=UPI002DD69402|nr:diguanylate cyclase [Pseudorhodoferax sp.]